MDCVEMSVVAATAFMSLLEASMPGRPLYRGDSNENGGTSFVVYLKVNVPSSITWVWVHKR